MSDGTSERSVVDGRYRIEELLGSGGTGTVYRATDAISGGSVAVKILSPLTTSAAMRHRREVLALRVLQVPGVARLLDEGVADGRPYIVMELVTGEPFPGGGRRTWAEIAPVAIALLETLARVHAAGVIHRDLKPANVLVQPDGRPVILDFGLARGDVLVMDAVTQPDAVAGTPRYQAPEQLRNETLDPRTDLYAVGVMLYEALGKPPHPLDDLSRLMAARLWKDAPPLQYVAPDVPPEVCRVVDRLLARLTEARPRTALEVLEELRALSGTGLATPLPWLGSEEPIRAALDAIRSGRCFDLTGPAGSGRTRYLQEIASALARGGRRAVFPVRGSHPYESLRPIIGEPQTLEVVPSGRAPSGGPFDPLPAADPDAIARELERRLRETIAGGTVVLVDDADDIDPWSSELLDRVRDGGSVVCAWRKPRTPNMYSLPTLTETALRSIFHGPDRLLHLREDAARALLDRTGGLPARVVSELAAWVSGGFATWRDGRLALDRTALDRLEGGHVVLVPPIPGQLGTRPVHRGLEHLLAWVTLAWPNASPTVLRAVYPDVEGWQLDMMVADLERAGAVARTPDGRLQPRVAALELQEWSEEQRRAAHALLATALEPGAVGRFTHLLRAGELSAAAREAQVVAARLAADGYVGKARGVLSQGLYAAREAKDGDAEHALLVEAALAALSENVVGALKDVRHEIGRAARTDELQALDALLVCALAELRGDTAGMRAARPPDFADVRLEVWRRAQDFHLAMRQGDAPPLLDAWRTWAEAADSSFLRGRVYGWVGLHLYQQGRFQEAAEWHVRALPLKEGTADRLSTMINAASAYLEAQELGEASRWAEEAFALASSHRLTLFEARAVWIRRCVAYRTRAATEPDLELVEAMSALGAPRYEMALLVTEATIAWRHGHHEIGASLAARAAAVLERDPNAARGLIVTALSLSCTAEASPERWRTVAEGAVRLGPGAAAAQILGLVAKAGVTWDPAWEAIALASVHAEPARDPEVWGTVLAAAEVLAYCRAARAP